MTRGDLPILWNRVQHDRRVYTAGTMCSKFCCMNSGCGMGDATDSERSADGEGSETYDGSGRRERGLPSYPTSTTIPRKSICFSVNVLSLPIVFVNPFLVMLRGACAGRVMSDPTARRGVLSHVVREFFLSMGRCPVGGCVRRMTNEFKFFG